MFQIAQNIQKSIKSNSKYEISILKFWLSWLFQF